MQFLCWVLHVTAFVQMKEREETHSTGFSTRNNHFVRYTVLTATQTLAVLICQNKTHLYTREDSQQSSSNGKSQPWISFGETDAHPRTCDPADGFVESEAHAKCLGQQPARLAPQIVDRRTN
jgi:hypothetical protein